MTAITINEVIRDYYEHCSNELSKYIIYLEQQKTLKKTKEIKESYDISNVPLDVNVLSENIEQYANELIEEETIINTSLDFDSMYLQQYYEKHLSNSEDDFKQFDFFDFFYQQNPFSFFASANLTYNKVIEDLHTLYVELGRMGETVHLISQENKISKPSTLHFLAKNKCEVGKIHFYSKYDLVWDIYDTIITANPTIIKNKPNNEDKKVIMVETEINKNFVSDMTIKKISDLL